MWNSAEVKNISHKHESMWSFVTQPFEMLTTFKQSGKG